MYVVRIAAAAVLAGAAFLSSSAASAQAQPTPSAANPVREISKIAGEIYRFRNNFHYSIYVVTPAGIIVTDPINKAAAEWLKAELKQRHPNAPVKFMVY